MKKEYAKDLNPLESFINKKIETGDINYGFLLLPKKFLSLADEDWEFIEDFLNVEKDGQLKELEELNMKIFGKNVDKNIDGK